MNHKSTPTIAFHHDFSNSRIALSSPIGSLPLKFTIFKFVCDKGLALLSLPVIFLISGILLLMNPFVNPGPLFFTQERMGMGGERFKMWKFRTMSAAHKNVRAHDAPLETDRISPFGRILRKFRIDELPNFLNVISGSMSVVGPRPDAWEHSVRYAQDIKYYNDRFRVRPGITGLAQVCGGYADTVRAIERKARLDLFYVEKSGAWLDVYIIGRTILVICSGFGAK